MRCGDGALGDGGVNVIGHVGGGAPGGQVGVVAQAHALALIRHRFSMQPLVGQARQGNVVKPDFRQGRGVA